MAIQLNGVNEAVNLDAHGAALDVDASPFAFYLEFQTISSNFMVMCGLGATDTVVELAFTLDTGNLDVYLNGSVEVTDDNGGSDYNDGNLHRALFIWRSSDDATVLWVDGVLVDSGLEAGTISELSDDTAIGYASGGGGSFWFEGELSNVAIWSTEISAGDAADLTDGTITPDEVTGTLQGFYPLLSNADDASGNSRDGTLVGSPTFTVGTQDINPVTLQPLVLNSPGVQTVLAPSVLEPLVLLAPTLVLATSAQDIEPVALEPLVLNSPGVQANLVPTVLQPLVLLSPTLTTEQQISPFVLEPLVLLSPTATLGLQMIEPVTLEPLLLLSPLVIVGDFQPILAGEGSIHDRIFQGLAAQGFTTGSISDRERSRLLSALGKGPLETGTIHDLYEEAGETPRLPWGGPSTA